jgi:hypothetical protein
MESYIFEQTGELETAGLDTSALTRTISDTPVAASILRHFAAIVGREWQS